MKTYLSLTIALICLASPVLAGVPEGAELKKMIVGKWKGGGEAAGAKTEGITEYKADGTFTSSGTLTIGDQTIKLSAEGTWTVKGKTLSWTVKKTINEDLMPVDTTATEEILEIDGDHMKYKDDDGEIQTETRIKDKEPAKEQKKPAGKQ